MSKIIPVIMSGGAGSRLWPLSRQAHPKQLLPLVGKDTMLQQTVNRLSGDDYKDPVFICNADHASAIKEQMLQMGRSIGAIITEPVGRNTAPVAVISALNALSNHPDDLVLLAPADHYVTKPDRFRKIVRDAAPAAKKGYIVTFGIKPSNPETGYGYIERAEAVTGSVFAVKAFHEKPDLERAKRYVKNSDFLWNAGLFLFSPSVFLAEAKHHAPDILIQASAAFEKAKVIDGVTHLNTEAFKACPSDSIDYAIMEKTKIAATIPCDIGWNDIGSFAALKAVRQDEMGLSVPDGTWTSGANNCLVDTDGPRVALIGVENIAVIVNNGVVSVVALDKAQDVKHVVTDIKIQGETEFL